MKETTIIDGKQQTATGDKTMQIPRKKNAQQGRSECRKRSEMRRMVKKPTG